MTKDFFPQKSNLCCMCYFSHVCVSCIVRSDTPLIYRAVPSWFVRVEQMTEELLNSNKKTYWYVYGYSDNRETKCVCITRSLL